MPQLKALGIPPDISDVESNLTFNPAAHLTLPAESAALQQTRQASNFGPAMAGLRTNQGGQLPPQRPDENQSFMGQHLTGPSRNQAMVDRMRADLGMSPEAAGDASISQSQLEAEHGPHEAFAHMIEQMKASAPATAAGVTARGQLAVKEAELSGARERELQGYQHIQDFLNSGMAYPGTTLSTPGGFTIRTAAPSQMLPPGVGGAAQKELDDARKALASLPTGGISGQFEEAKGLLSGKSLAQHRAELQQKINDLERQLGVSPSTGATPPAPAQPQTGHPPASGGTGQWITLPSGRRVYREQ